MLLLPILECAGTDISSWFDPQTGDVSERGAGGEAAGPPPHLCSQIRRCVDPLTHCVRYYTPRGRFVHVPPAGPSSDWDTDIGQPWWSDERYQVGRLSAKTRWVRVINMLTSQEQELQVSREPRSSSWRQLARRDPARLWLQVCSEETLGEILQRYLHYNAHAGSYTWKHNGLVLDMSRTLVDNGIPDDDLELQELRLDPHQFTPAIQLYFNDDLTEG